LRFKANTYLGFLFKGFYSWNFNTFNQKQFIFKTLKSGNSGLKYSFLAFLGLRHFFLMSFQKKLF